jgi:hypothetical protein
MVKKDEIKQNTDPQPIVDTVSLDDKRMNEATKLVLNTLPTSAGEVINELAEDHYVEPWHVLCGIVLECHLSGTLSKFTLDPDWALGVKRVMSKCKHVKCGKMYKPIYLGQLYCSNDCGSAVNEEASRGGNSTNIPSKRMDDLSDITDVDGGSGTTGWADAPDAGI